MKPIKILFIGNSYTQQHNIPDQVRDFAERGQPGAKVETMRVIYGGSQAERHWNNYGTSNLLNLSRIKLQDLEEHQQRMSEEMEVLKKIIEQETKELKPQKQSTAFSHYRHFQSAIEYHKEWAGLLNDPPKFDFVVLQSHRDDIGLESSYANHARKFAEVIHDHGAKMILYVTAHLEQNGQPLAELPDPKPVMEQAEALARLGNELDATVVPVALAIHKLREKRLDLTTRYATDGHLNQVCAYLTLCCFYAALFDKNPAGFDLREVNAWAGDKKDADGNPMHRIFDEATATVIQQSAWEAVQEVRNLQEKFAAGLP